MCVGKGAIFGYTVGEPGGNELCTVNLAYSIISTTFQIKGLN